MRIGFIGLGNMGEPMARNVQQAGYDLIVHDLNKERADFLLANGAEWAKTVADCAAGCDVLLTSLPGPPQTETVMAGERGALAHLKPGSIWLDMTTNRPGLVQRLAKEAPPGVQVVDAPVTGAVDGARQGRLYIFVGGEAATVAQVSPILEAMGSYIHCGPLGTGNIVKLITNQLWFIHACAIGEGLVLGVKAGVEPLTLWEALKNSVGDSFVCRHDVPSIFAGHYDPSFTLDLCVKDLGLIHELAEEVEVPIELSSLAQDIFKRSREKYGGDQAELLVVKQLEEQAGVSLSVPGDWIPHWKK